MNKTNISDAITQGANQEFLKENGVSAKTYGMIYRAGAPWETGEAQPEIINLHQRGDIKGRVLDVGCGLGANTRYLAENGYDIIGIDFVEDVIHSAKEKSRNYNGTIKFQAMNIFEISHETFGFFETIIDSATLHGFSNEERLRYADCLAKITKQGAKVHIVGISDKETRPGGPRRLSREVIYKTFSSRDWYVEECRTAKYLAHIFPGEGKAISCRISRQ